MPGTQALIKRVINNAASARKLAPQEQAFVIRLYRLLAEGSPVSRDRLADAFGVTRAIADQVLELVPRSSIDWDDDGNIVAFGGLTLKKTSHQITIGETTLYTWCAFDTLFLAPLLGDATIVSTDPETNASIRFEVGPEGSVGGTGVYMSLVAIPPGSMRNNVRAAFCHHVHFFENGQTGNAFAERHPDMAILPLPEAVRMGVQWNDALFGDALREEA